MPFVFKFSGFVLFLASLSGQLWLHDAADRAAIASARSALRSCSGLSGADDLRSSWDVVRAQDRARVAWLASAAGLRQPCSAA